MRRIVSNTGPILHLLEIQALDLLLLAGEVIIPRRVDEETSCLIKDWGRHRPEWLRISQNSMQPDDIFHWVAAGVIHDGEAAALALAREAAADWFLTDDTAARLLGRTLGLEVHGSLGVVLWAAASRHVTYAQARQLLDRLSGSSLWISARVLAEAHAALSKIYA